MGRIAIHGFGRIGRSLMKVALKNDLFVPVSISDIKDLSTLPALDRIFDRTRNAAYEIIQRKKTTYYAIGLGLLSIVDAILRDQHTVLTISSPLFGQYDVDGISISMPTIVGRRGIEGVLKLSLSEAEQMAFQASAQTLKEWLFEL